MPDRPAPDVFKDLHFPKCGVDLSAAFSKQPNRQLQDGAYARTAPSGVNVRTFDSVNRARGGSRPGLSKFNSAAVVPGWMLQELAIVVQANQAGRVVTVVAVSQGQVYYAPAGATSWTLATNTTGNNPPLNFTGVLYSAPNNQLLWFADGINFCYFNSATGTVLPWVASAGQLPRDSAGNAPRLICTWRGRTVLSGLLLDPQDWFMSAVGDPTDFDYSPLSITPTQAVAGINAPQGVVGDVVTTLIPYTDDVLVFGGDHTIWMMQGDPMAGGQIDLVSDSIGMAWGIPWCKDPFGNIYFVSNRTGIYTLVPGQQPQRISQAIEQLLLGIDLGANTIRLLWDDRYQGLHVFVSPTAAPGSPGTVTHFFYEVRAGAWWTEQFADPNMDPLTCCVFDGNTPGDRVPLIGSWDGYVRAVDPTATTDDGTAIQTSVLIGPILTADLAMILCKDAQAVLGHTSGTVNFAFLIGATAEQALASTPVVTGTWGADRNLLTFVRRAGHAIYVQLTSSNPWALESIRLRLQGQGKVQKRGR